MRSLHVELSDDGYLELFVLSSVLGISIRHAASLVLLSGLKALIVSQPLDSEDAMKFVDQFGKPIESDRVYGIGRSETKCVLHETQYDHDIDEIVIRKRGCTGQFGRLDESDLSANDSFYLVDPHTLSAYESDPREEPTDEPGLRGFLDDQLASIVLDLHKTLCREKMICARLGISVSDGSDLADMVCRFVRDPDSVTVGDLLRMKLKCRSVS